MDRRRAPAPPSRRDVVFCHECEHEWYRDERGLTCPECHSDFTEIIEPDNDPRTTFAADDFPPPSTPFDPGNAPDPDIDDIDPFSRTFFPRGGPSMPNQDPVRTEVHRNFQNTFSGLLGANATPRGVRGTWTTRTINLGNGGTMTFSSGTLFPRDANGPQPGMMPVDNLHNVLSQLLLGMDGLGGPAGPPRGGPMAMPGGAAPLNPIGALFNAMFNPSAAQHGDAVYTQEALDRVISQLMEQNATGNAPGPASAEALANLPTIKVSKEMLGDNGKASCSICMDEVQLDDEVARLPCAHWFHEQCVKAWLSEHDTCPHCRKGIGEEAEQASGASSGRSAARQWADGTVTTVVSEVDANARTAGYQMPFPSSRRRSSGLGRSSRRPSEQQPSRRPSESNHGGGGGLLDRARSLFGGRREP